MHSERTGDAAGLAKTLAHLDSLPPPLHNDPRVLILKADAAGEDLFATHKRATAARAEAEHRKLPFLVAEAAMIDAYALRFLGPKVADYREPLKDAKKIYGDAGDEVTAALAVAEMAASR